MTVAPIMSPSFFKDMFPTYQWLRDNDPVHFVPPMQVWFVTRHEDVLALLKDNDNFSVENMPVMKSWHPDVQYVMQTLFKDEPDHGRLRGVLNDFFSASKIRKRQGKIGEIVKSAIQKLKDSGKAVIDIEKDYAYTIPIDTLCVVMGLPKEDYPLFHKWAPLLGEALQPMQTPEQKEKGAITACEVRDYLIEHFRKGNLKPEGEDTILSLLKDAVDTGVMTEEEIVPQAVQIYIGGHETTLSLIGKCIYALLTNPAELAKIKENPKLVSKAVEETVRWNGVSHVIGRALAKDYTLHGKTMKAGDMVFLCNGAANRDERVFPNPDKFDIERKRTGPHLGFGHGLRYCLGNVLARMETQLAITALFEAFPNLELADPTSVHFNTNLMLHGITTLPVKLNK